MEAEELQKILEQVISLKESMEKLWNAFWVLNVFLLFTIAFFILIIYVVRIISEEKMREKLMDLECKRTLNKINGSSGKGITNDDQGDRDDHGDEELHKEPNVALRGQSSKNTERK